MARYQFVPLDDDKAARLGDCLAEARDIINSVCNGEQVADMRELLKPRKGFDLHLSTILHLAEQFHVVLPGHNAEDMKKNMKVQRQLGSAVNQLEALAKQAREIYSASRSETWDAFLNFYGVLSAMGTRFHDLKTMLRPITDFMARKSNKEEAKDDSAAL